MDGVTIIETAWGDFDAAIEIRKSPAVLATAKKVSGFMSDLPLTSDQHNALVALLMEHHRAAMRCGFAEGVRFVLALEEHESNSTENSGKD